jgi:hypothetical protein
VLALSLLLRDYLGGSVLYKSWGSSGGLSGTTVVGCCGNGVISRYAVAGGRT